MPSVLFVCVRNAGKSQMAAALARLRGGGKVEVHSAGTDPHGDLNAESVASLARVGASCAGEHPKPVDAEVLRRVDRVVVVGTAAHVDPVAGMRGTIEVWDTDEPSLRGIEGPQRMDLIRDDIDARVRGLLDELGVGASPPGDAGPQQEAR